MLSSLQEIILNPSFKSSSLSLQQQISHLSFVVNLICNNVDEASRIIEEHGSVKVVVILTKVTGGRKPYVFHVQFMSNSCPGHVQFMSNSCPGHVHVQFM